MPTSAEYRVTESLNAFRTPQALVREGVLGEGSEGDGQRPVLNHQLRFEVPKNNDSPVERGPISDFRSVSRLPIVFFLEV